VSLNFFKVLIALSIGVGSGAAIISNSLRTNRKIETVAVLV